MKKYVRSKFSQRVKLFFQPTWLVRDSPQHERRNQERINRQLAAPSISHVNLFSQSKNPSMCHFHQNQGHPCLVRIPNQPNTANTNIRSGRKRPANPSPTVLSQPNIPRPASLSDSFFNDPAASCTTCRFSYWNSSKAAFFRHNRSPSWITAMDKPTILEIAENRYLFHDPYEIVQLKWRAEEPPRHCPSALSSSGNQEELAARSVFAGDAPLAHSTRRGSPESDEALPRGALQALASSGAELTQLGLPAPTHTSLSQSGSSTHQFFHSSSKRRTYQGHGASQRGTSSTWSTGNIFKDR